jgi:hypothetical protein
LSLIEQPELDYDNKDIDEEAYAPVEAVVVQEEE